jgi:hypothetical protein
VGLGKIANSHLFEFTTSVDEIMKEFTVVNNLSLFELFATPAALVTFA